MSIQDDIEALEKALADPLRNYSTWCGYKDACSPDRIRRLLDALKAELGGPWRIKIPNARPFRSIDYIESEEMLDEYVTCHVEYETGELRAKLSKAIELLKASRDVYVLGHELPMQWGAVEKIDSFLREAGHE